MPSDVMDLEVFGETLYVAPCTAQGIRLVACIADHEPQVITARQDLCLGESDSLLDVLHDRLKQAVCSTKGTEQVSCVPGQPASLSPFSFTVSFMLQNTSEGARMVGPTTVNETSSVSGMIYACTHSGLNHCSGAGGAARRSHSAENTQNHAKTSGGQHAEMQGEWKDREKW